MFGGSKIKLENELMDRVKKASALAGYSSVDEFVAHVIEKELSRIDDGGGSSEEEIKKRLEGLGYIS